MSTSEIPAGAEPVVRADGTIGLAMPDGRSIASPRPAPPPATAARPRKKGKADPGPRYVVRFDAVRHCGKGDIVTLADLGPHADIDHLLGCGAIAPHIEGDDDDPISA